MMISITIGTLVSIVIGICSAVVGSVLWVGAKIERASDKTAGRIDGIRDELAKFRIEYVSEDLCRERRQQCMCVAQMSHLQASMDRLEEERHGRE